jgi:hypothetical protein
MIYSWIQENYKDTNDININQVRLPFNRPHKEDKNILFSNMIKITKLYFFYSIF